MKQLGSGNKIKILKFLSKNSEKISHWATTFGFIVAGLGGYLAYSQLLQANDHRSWQNYNEMNTRYAELYKDIPENIANGCIPDDFGETSQENQRWVRQYFNLYSEEYWLYLNKLIPEEMWTRRIYAGVRVNLSRYPGLVSGYRYWRSQGAFTHPNSFQNVVEKAIQEAAKMRRSKVTKCNNIALIKQK